MGGEERPTLTLTAQASFSLKLLRDRGWLDAVRDPSKGE